MLADWQIHEAVGAEGAYNLYIKGYKHANVNPASYDLTLSPKVRVLPVLPKIVRDVPLDVAFIEPDYTVLGKMTEDGMILNPNEFILAATNEVVGLPQNLVARVEGKSSLGRIGLAVHITAGFIDPGFVGSITLEIVNMLGRPIRLRPNMRIAQVAFIPMSAPPMLGYEKTGHYQNQGISKFSEPVESRYSHREVD